MLFKNLYTYKLIQPIDSELLAESMNEFRFVPCPSNFHESVGFVNPGPEDALINSIFGHNLICLQTEKKILPAAVVNREAEKRAAEIEKSQGYKPGRKQMRELKERISEEFMSRAFTKVEQTFAWIDNESSRLHVNASTVSKAEDFISYMSALFNEPLVSMVHTKLSPTTAMVDLLTGNDENKFFTVDRDLELQAVGEEATKVRYIQHELDNEETMHHLASGKVPTRLALTFDDRISFVMHSDGSLHKVALLDVIECEEHDDEYSQFKSDCALMFAELSRMNKAIEQQILGGEVA